MPNKKLTKTFRKFDKSKQTKETYISGELGIPINGQKVVQVPNRPGFVFVRLKGNTSELIQAYNSTVSLVYGLPVLVVRAVGIYKVVGRNLERYTNQWGNAAPFLPKHGPQHSFNPSLGIGGDVTWVYTQQFMPLLAFPSGTDGSPRLAISPYFVQDLNGNWKYIGNTGTPDISIYNPTTGSRAIIGLMYLDTQTGNPGYLINSGTMIDSSLTGSNQIVDYIPRVTNPNYLPDVAIRLVSGTSVLTWNNLYDVRPFLRVIPTGSASAGGGIDTIGFAGLDEGIPLGTGTSLNVVGAGATLTLSGTMFNLNISGGGGGGGGVGVMAWDEGIPLGTGTVFNFVGDGVTATVSGTVIQVSAVALPYIYVRDEKAAGTEGGSSSSNTWMTRTLNTEVSDTGNNCTLSSNQMTLVAGTYQCKASAPARTGGASKIRLRNVTDGATVLVGKSCYADSNDSVAVLVGVFTIAAGKALELQHIVAIGTATNGLGLATDLAGRATNSDEVEVYAEIEFWKVS